MALWAGKAAELRVKPYGRVKLLRSVQSLAAGKDLWSGKAAELRVKPCGRSRFFLRFRSIAEKEPLQRKEGITLGA